MNSGQIPIVKRHGDPATGLIYHFNYTSEDGSELICQVVRKEDKKIGNAKPKKHIFQRRPAVAGEKVLDKAAEFDDGAWWISDLSGVTPPLFNLHELATTPPEVFVVVVEGEKKCVNLAARDKSVVVTTAIGGAGRKWDPAWTKYFQGRDVLVCPDCEDKGRRHAEKIAGAIYGAAARVRIVDWNKLWPDRPEGKLDIDDYLNSNPDENDVLARLHAASDEPMPDALRDRSGVNGTKSADDLTDAELEKHADQAGFQLYWLEDGGTNFIVHNEETDTWSHWPESKVVGKLRERSSHGNGIDESQAQRVLRHVMERRIVHLMLPSLSGYPIGLYQFIDGRLALVRSEPRKPKPAPGDWSLIEELLRAKFNDQILYVYGWLKHSIETLLFSTPGDFAPGLALILSGEVDAGKSFIQNHVITPLIGWRSADPEPYLTEKTDFNAELFSAEHLEMEDPASDGTYKSRLRLGQGIKKLVATETQRCHPKNRTAITVKPFFRLTVSINKSQESLQVLPALEPTVRGKLLVLEVAEEMGPLPTRSEERKSFCERIEGQSPAFAHYLLNEFKLPDDLRCGRFGVKAFIHPSVASLLFGRSPQAELLLYIDAARWGADGTKTLWDQANDETTRKFDPSGIWYGTAVRLEDLLTSSSVSTKVERLLRKIKLSRLLGDLEEQTERVVHIHDADAWRWMIERL